MQIPLFRPVSFMDNFGAHQNKTNKNMDKNSGSEDPGQKIRMFSVSTVV